MMVIAVLLTCAAVKVTQAAEVECRNDVPCPCGNKGESVVVCVPENSTCDEVCTRLLKCERCDGLACSKCPEGFTGPFCSEREDPSRPKRQIHFPGHENQREKVPGVTAAPSLVCPHPGQVANADSFNMDHSPSTGGHTAGVPKYPVGHLVVYSCHDGFSLQGRSVLRCLASGKWSSQVPYCWRIPTTTAAPSLVCPHPGQVANADSLNMDDSPSTGGHTAGVPKYPVGHFVVYSCHEGFSLQGRSGLRCLASGKWSSQVPYCWRIPTTTDSSPIVYCDYPGDLDNGRIVHIPQLNQRLPTEDKQEQYPEGSRLRYSCEKKYDLEGVTLLVCLSTGRWSSLPPRCTPDLLPLMYCKYPGEIVNGQVVHIPAINERRGPPSEKKDEYPEESHLRYSCDPGYSLEGPTTLTCRNTGRWSSNPPRCIPVYCDYPGDLDNGRIVHIPQLNQRRPTEDKQEQYPEGSRLRYSCEEEYALEGPTVLACLNTGRWSSAPPRCTPGEPEDIMYCDNPGLIQDGKVEFIPPAIKKRDGSPDYVGEEFPELSRMEYSCEEGYRLEGRQTLTCQSSGRWSSDAPTCVPDCGLSFMRTVANGFKTVSGDWPWVMSISIDDRFICGGSVINTHTVITAAHCLVSVRQLTLRFGKHHFNVGADDEEVLVRKSSRIIIHPDYSNKTLDSDIGLILFRPKIRYSVRTQPICLPTWESTVQNVEPGNTGYVGGWGETQDQVAPEQMMLASLPVVSKEVCEDAYKDTQLVITSNMFCAGYEDARQSVCGGDSGSPFVFYNRRIKRYTLEGLVSFGIRGQCGVAGNYAIFTKVFRFSTWIRKNSK